jgi:hypothetical protein
MTQSFWYVDIFNNIILNAYLMYELPNYAIHTH